MDVSYAVVADLMQSCPWVGSTRGLGRVGSGWGGLGGRSGLGRVGLGCVEIFDGLGWIEYDKSTIFFDDCTTYNCTPVELLVAVVAVCS